MTSEGQIARLRADVNDRGESMGGRLRGVRAAVVRNEANFRVFGAVNGGLGGKQSQFAFPTGMGDLAHRSTIGKVAFAAATPHADRIVSNKANFAGSSLRGHRTA